MNDTDPAAQLEVIDKQRALDLLDKALTERGEDYVYEKVRGSDCVYFDDGQPSCLVGHALAKHGAGAAAFRRHNATRAQYLAASFPWISPQAAQVFDEAQTIQDDGGTWGEAVAAAYKEAQR